MIDFSMPVETFLLGGNATITMKQLIGGSRHFTYQIEKPKTSRGPALAFVKVNTGEGGYKFIGSIFPESGFRHSLKSPIGERAASVQCFDWLWKNRNRRDMLEKYTDLLCAGVCCVCGRELTNPESAAKGIGPVCEQKLGN